MGNIGSIPGTYIWRSEYGPYYKKPFGAMVAILSFSCVLAFGLRTYLIYLNKKLDQEQGPVPASDERRDRRGVEFDSEMIAGIGGVRKFRYLY
jgi:hypothetical protein